MMTSMRSKTGMARRVGGQLLFVNICIVSREDYKRLLEMLATVAQRFGAYRVRHCHVEAASEAMPAAIYAQCKTFESRAISRSCSPAWSDENIALHGICMIHCAGQINNTHAQGQRRRQVNKRVLLPTMLRGIDESSRRGKQGVKKWGS